MERWERTSWRRLNAVYAENKADKVFRMDVSRSGRMAGSGRFQPHALQHRGAWPRGPAERQEPTPIQPWPCRTRSVLMTTLRKSNDLSRTAHGIERPSRRRKGAQTPEQSHSNHSGNPASPKSLTIRSTTASSRNTCCSLNRVNEKSSFSERISAPIRFASAVQPARTSELARITRP